MPGECVDTGWQQYYRACLRSRPAVEALEKAIQTCGTLDCWCTVEDLRNRAGHALSLDQVLSILGALEAIGVVELGRNHRWRARDSAWQGTSDLRSRLRDAVTWTQSILRQNEPSLLLSAPAGATLPAFRREFADLRTTLRSLIASSQRELILASPFWDVDVATDIADLLQKRLAAGVHVRIVSRQPTPGSPSDRAIVLLSQIRVNDVGCDIRIVDRPSSRDRFGRETFHFKMIGADSAAAYVGSANFDTAGLSSRWELGVLLNAPAARVIFDFVAALADDAPAYEIR